MDSKEIARNLMNSLHMFRRVIKPPHHFEGLKPSEMGLLMHIREASRAEPEGVKVSELSDMMRVTSPSITQFVTGLEERELVERRMGREDRRFVKVSLTDKGREFLDKAEDHFLGVMAGLVDHLGPVKSAALSDLLNESYEYLKSLNDRS